PELLMGLSMASALLTAAGLSAPSKESGRSGISTSSLPVTTIRLAGTQKACTWAGCRNGSRYSRHLRHHHHLGVDSPMDSWQQTGVFKRTGMFGCTPASQIT